MLTVLRVISQHLDEYGLRDFNPSVIRRNDFKIIYVCVRRAESITIKSDSFISAPMKALAAEIVRKLGKRLKWLNILVRELTGQ